MPFPGIDRQRARNALKLLLNRPALLFGSLLLVLVQLLNPFGLRDASEGHADRWLLKMTAPFYPRIGQDDVVVVLIDDESLRQLDSTWPMTYRQQANLLRRVLDQQPRGVFVDVLYSQRRDSPLSPLLGVLDRARRAGIPLILADYRDAQGHSLLLPEFSAANTAVVNWSGHGARYPLRLDEQRPSPAMWLYAVHCQQAGCSLPPDDAKPMLVRWGYWAPTTRSAYQSARGCTTYERGWGLGEPLRLLWRDGTRAQQDADRVERPQPCPYTRTVFAEQLLHDPASAALLKDKLVLVGVNVRGVPDWVNSPVQGQLAGVYLHAMALDNLIGMGTEYWREASTRLGDVSDSDLLQLVLVLLASAIALWLESRKQRSAWRHQYWFWLIGLSAIALGSSLLMWWLCHIAPLDWIGVTMTIGAFYAFLGQDRLADLWQRLLGKFSPQLVLKEDGK